MEIMLIMFFFMSAMNQLKMYNDILCGFSINNSLFVTLCMLHNNTQSSNSI